nr:hypothetical protein [Tanacetum cinerariifolium]
MKDPSLFILPCRLGDCKPFDTLADLGSCVNLLPLKLFKELKVGLLKETDDILGLADGTKSYPVGIVKNVEVHVGKLKLCEDFYVVDMMRIEQYFLMTDYSLWEVIFNGDSPAPIRVIEGDVQLVAPTTVEQRLARKNELKARGTLLMAFLDKHQLKFNIHKDAKTLMKEIEKQFGRNKETKKVQKTLLKQQYENFTGSSSKSLDQIHDRLQKLISQLEILGESLSQKDINLKFLRSLPTEWRTHTLIWRNKTYLEEQSLDDLFNSLKIYEAEVKSSSSARTSTQNIAFVSSQNTESTNEPVSVVASVSVASEKIPVFTLPNVDTLSNAVIYSFFASQSNSLQLENDELKQIDADDLEEMDLKWQMSMLTVRARRFLQMKGRNLRENGPTSMGFDMSKVKCYNCNRKGHFARECRSSKDTRRNVSAEPQRRNVPAEEKPTNYAIMEFTSLSSSSSDNEIASCSKACTKLYDTLQFHYEARLLVYQQNEIVFEEDIKLLKLEVQLRDNALVVLRQKIEEAEQERYDLKLKLEKFQTSSKNLSQLLASQTNDKTGLGYNTQVFTSFMFDCDEMFSSKTDESFSASLIYDRYQSGEGYHVVPHPYTGTFMPHKPDLVFHDASNVSDSKDDYEAELSQNALSFIQPNEQVKTPRPSVKPVETSVPADNHKTAIPKPKTHGNIRHRKACFVSVLTKSKLVPLTAARQVTTAVPQPHVTKPRLAKTVVTKPYSPPKRTIICRPSSSASNFPLKVTAAKAPKGGKISGKGKIRTGKLDFDDVYFVKELKFNLFSVSQMCDKKNIVLFTNTKCIVLSPEFNLLDENQMLLRVHRENNMYNVDLKNIVPSGDLTCLFSKETLDESNLWHRRLGHINFKTMNKLVKGNLVRGLPSKVFENNHTCVACKKGKQHRASCNTKRVSSVLVTKPQNKTPYELLLGRTPSIGFMRPLGCLVTILNTLNPLGKFDGKVDEGFLVRYSVSSKAFRVFNSRTRIVQETLHINFLENKPNVAGNGPTWLFDIDTLTKTMNYQPVTVGNQSNPSVGVQKQFDAEKAGKKNVQQYVLFPLWSSGSKIPQNTNDDASFKVKEPEFEGRKPEFEVHVSSSSSAQTKKHDDKTKREAKRKSHVELSTGYRNLSAEFKDFSDNSINEDNAAGTSVPAVGQISTNSTNAFSAASPSTTAVKLEDITYSDDDEDVGAVADFTNLETTITEEGIDYEEVFDPLARIEAIRLFLAYASFMGFMVYQMDVKSAFLYGTIKEEVYVCQPPGFEDPDYPDKVYKVVKALYGLHQTPRAWYETLANYLLENGFQMGKIDHTLFIKRQKDDILLVQICVDDIIFDGKSASTPIDTEKPLLKDPDGEDVDVHTYKSMTGSLMYLTSSIPDIMFAVCACARFQVTPKVSHLHAVKRIFRYLKGNPHLGLWYRKDSPFNLMAYSDSDYADASEGFDQIIDFLNSSSIKYALTVNPNIYVSCIKQFWSSVLVKKVNDVIRLQALVDRKNVIITEATVREALRLDDAESIDCLPNEEIFTELSRMGYEKLSTKLTFYKAFFSPQWKFLIFTILQCMSAKRTL